MTCPHSTLQAPPPGWITHSRRGAGSHTHDVEMTMASPPRTVSDDDFHVTAEGIEELDEPLRGEARQLSPEKRRNLGLVNAEELRSRRLSQASGFEDLRNLRRQLRL